MIESNTQFTFDTTYYNENWQQVSIKDSASFYRIVTAVDDNKSFVFQVSDYYISGQLQMTGVYKQINPDVKEGLFTYFYESGTKQLECFYRDNVLDKTYTEWNKNGQLKIEKEYTLGNLHGLLKNYNKEGNLVKQARYEDGKLHGQFKTFYDNGQLKRKDTYKNDVLISGECYSFNGGDTAYFPYLVLPQFKGGWNAFTTWVNKELVYPAEALVKKDEGKVNVKITISSEGDISNIDVVNANKEYFNKEAVRVLKSSPKWIPGKIDGKIREISLIVPIIFSFK